MCSACEQLFTFRIHFLYSIILFIVSIQCVYSTDNYFTTNVRGFNSVPTTVKTYENETVLLPCYSSSKCFKFNFKSFPYKLKPTIVYLFV